MTKIIRTTVLVLSLAVSLAIADAALAANDLTLSTDAIIDLSSPDVNLTVPSASTVDSLTVNTGSLNVTMSDGGTLTLRSTDRKTFTHNSGALAVDITCNDSYSQIAVTAGASVSGSSFTITVSSDTCTTSGGSTGGGGGGGGGGAVTTTVPTPTTTTTTETTVAADARAAQWEQVLTDATAVYSGDVSAVLSNTGDARSLTLESSAASAYTKPLISGVSGVSAATTNAITNFVAYGTKGTESLGAGERAGVVNSYKSAFSKLPAAESEWKDILAIANGRWPGETSATAESNAKTEFKKVYLKDADMKNAYDNAAVTVMAYGLRPSNRNLNSEKAAIKTFKAIYGHNPVSALAWDIVRAIAYSGAKR
ncbi:hypothetical protein HY798_03830 [Candidatus Falkowbacteria bacterium]|nr:hypothetical protein [Candidatus Falkowbacteria bacterium]